MELNINEDEKEYLLREYKEKFEESLTSKGELKYYFRGIFVGIKIVLKKLGITTDEELLRIEEEVYDKLEAEMKEPLIYEF